MNKRGYLGKTMLSSEYVFRKLEEDGEVEYVVIMCMTMKDGTRENEIVESISEKDYFLYTLGAKKYNIWDRYKRTESGS